MSLKSRSLLREVIEKEAVAWATGILSPVEIDEHNILKASFLAMHRALDQLHTDLDHILIDGNRFIPYAEIPYSCIIKGDGKYYSIAAASVIAKTHRDEIMVDLHNHYPDYGWNNNKGYPTQAHRSAIADRGITEYHRKSFKLLPDPTLFD